MKKRSAAARNLFSVISILLACVLLSSCSSMESTVQKYSFLQSFWNPVLTLSESEYGISLPVIEHSGSAEEVTEQLQGYFTPIVEMLAEANSEADIFDMEYELTQIDGMNYLRSAIVCSVGGSIELPEIHIPYLTETVIPAWNNPLPGADPEELAAYLELTANDVTFDTANLDDTVSPEELYSCFIEYYREVSGLDVDTSRFSEYSEYSDLEKQVMVMDMSVYVVLDYIEQVDVQDMLLAGTSLLANMYSDACGKGSGHFSLRDLGECIRAFLGTDIFHDPVWSEAAVRIDGFVEDYMAGAMAEEATCRDIAEFYVDIYEKMYGTIYYDDYFASESQYDDEVCIKADYAGLTGSFPSFDSCSGTYRPSFSELPDAVYRFLWVCSQYGSQLETSYETKMTNRDALIMLSTVDRCVRTAGLCEEEPTVVINDRDYEWYYTQHGTGLYSSVNCMPTIAMMATRWYDEDTTVTVQEMRKRYLPEYKAGWYMWQVQECLEQNGVPTYQAELEEDKLAFLDEGKIILTQMSEFDDVSEKGGHCFIIYGYWKRGETVKYYIHDPDVYDGIDDYGRRPGYAMLLDSNYCEWIIDRIAIYYLAAG